MVDNVEVVGRRVMVERVARASNLQLKKDQGTAAADDCHDAFSDGDDVHSNGGCCQ